VGRDQEQTLTYYALLVGAAADLTAPDAKGKRQLAQVEPRITRQYDRRALRVADKAELAFTYDLRTGIVLHDVAAGVRRVIHPRSSLSLVLVTPSHP